MEKTKYLPGYQCVITWRCYILIISLSTRLAEGMKGSKISWDPIIQPSKEGTNLSLTTNESRLGYDGVIGQTPVLGRLTSKLLSVTSSSVHTCLESV
mmetsp:Transcript_2509/g.3490  ORF Transcript_2509/g.3490 Transcript_2509/m.3490 type:complete len:97 (-) Transcript_2509:100-390(-)